MDDARSKFGMMAIEALAGSMLLASSFTPHRPIRVRKRDEVKMPTLHPTKGWRGMKKKQRAKFKRRGRKS